MDHKEIQPTDKVESKVQTSPRDKGDMYHGISEGLYLNVFHTDELSVERASDVLVFKF